MYFCPPHSKVYYVEVGKEDPAAECSDIRIQYRPGHKGENSERLTFEMKARP